MTPDRWQRIKELFASALERDEDARSAFLEEACAADPALRSEVNALLSEHERADGFLDHPAGQGLSLPADDGAPEASPPRLTPGQRVGPYEVIALLGEGGMGQVYRARDLRLEREVAIKVLPPHLANDAWALGCFEREARAVAALSHPNILAIHDIGTENGISYAVVELLEGVTLRGRLAGRPLPGAKVLEVAEAVAEGLAAAHAKGVIHRDLKPDNVFLTSDGRVKILDFGIARVRPVPTDTGGEASSPLTQTGQVMGTLEYMSPEQARGGEVDARSDIFSLGCVLYEMATGHRAFARATPADTLAAVLHEDPFETRTTARRVPLPLERIIRRCLEKTPDERFQSARDIGFALKEASAEVGPETRLAWLRPVVWIVVLVVAAVAMLRWSRPLGDGTDPERAPNASPVVVLMDSPLAGRVYDPRTEAAGGTNADDLTDALRELPVLLQKENTSAMWHREEQVLRQNPDLIISHLSCLLDARVAGGQKPIYEHLFSVSGSRLLLFFGYVGVVNPRTRFLVYSRGEFNDPAHAAQWVRDAEARLPSLRGRLFTFAVPGGRVATFRDPDTARLIRERVQELVGTGSTRPRPAS
jgi:hypothetical protein